MATQEISIPPIHKLSIETAFESLSIKEKLYAHHMSRAAWHGTRIIHRQVSPESIGIFDLILEIYASCSGDWNSLASDACVAINDVDAFVHYAATFLSNVGNYYGSGDQNFVPNITPESLEKLCSTSPKAQKLHDEVAHAMLSCPPFSLGFPSHLTQSAYYPGSSTITKDEIAAVSKVLEERSIFPENTRIRKIQETEISIFEVIQASVQTDDQPLEFSLPNSTILEDQNVVLKEYDPTCEGVIKSWAERGV